MAVDWRIKGLEVGNCNCAFGCPCQFNALPTYGNCMAAVGIQIDEGHFGDVKLDGLRFGFTLNFPGAVHEGNGTWQSIIDERADEQQRDALTQISHGEHTNDGATMLQVYNSLVTTRHDPVVSAIEFECDKDARKARVTVPGLLDIRLVPITNPVTGEEHQAKIQLTGGFEYLEAEMANGSTTCTGAIPLDLSGSYGQICELHLNQNGIVR